MDKQEFEMQKELIELSHRYKLIEIEEEKKAKLEVQRIKSAEIKRTIDRRYNS